MSAAGGPYEVGAPLWRAAGWLGTLPVVGKDLDLPAGYSGRSGGWPSDAQVQEWVEVRGKDNLAIRLPDTVLGLDVDAYDGRNGLRTLESFEARFGQLPATYVSSARTDGSGIRLYRVPPGVTWVSNLGHDSHVDVIRFGHRYAVTWPSVHPQILTQYRLWLPIGGLTTESIPRPEQLAALPGEWVKGLTRAGAGNTSVSGAGSGGAAEPGNGTWSTGVSREPDSELDDRVDPELVLFRGLPPGEQDEGLYRYLCHLRSRKLSRDEAIHLGVVAISRMEQSRPEEPWTPQHVVDKVQRIWRQFPAGTTIEQELSRQLRDWARGTDDGAAGSGPETRSAPDSDHEGADSTERSDPAGEALSEALSDLQPIPRPEGGESLTDTGNADRYVRMFYGRTRYVPELRQWHVWNGQRWLVDTRNEAYHRTRFVATDVREDVENLVSTARDGDERAERRTQAEQWARASESERARRATLANAAADPRLIVPVTELDEDPRLLVCENGVVELLDDGWKFRSGRPSDKTTLSTRIDFSAEARSEDWERFVAWIQPDPALRRHLQALDGYSLYGANPLRIWVILKGDTATGKSTHLELINATLGDYVITSNISIFRSHHDEKPRPDLVRAMPARRVHLSEVEAESYLHADQVKRVTGGDAISARGLYAQTTIELVPRFTPITAMNGLPTIEAADQALLKRLWPVPFGHRIDRDPSGEMESVVGRLRYKPPVQAILNWLLEGWNLYRQGVLEDPVEARESIALEVAGGLSEFDEFIEQYCDVDAGYSDIAERLFLAYQCWEHDNGVPHARRLSTRGFGLALKRHGYVQAKRQWVEDVNGERRQKTVWHGLCVKMEHHAAVLRRAQLKNWGA